MASKFLCYFLGKGLTLVLVCVELDTKLISASNEPTPPSYIEFEEMMVNPLNEPCSGGGAQLLDAIELGSNINFPPFVTL